MRWCRFGTDFFVCDCEKRKMYWMYIEFFGKKQAGKDVPKMCRRINQRFLNILPSDSTFFTLCQKSTYADSRYRRPSVPVIFNSEVHTVHGSVSKRTAKA